MKVLDAIASSLGYVDGLRDVAGSGAGADAQAFLEHLTTQGFVVRPRGGAERLRLKPDAFEQHGVSADQMRNLRHAAGLSVTTLAALAGVSADTIRGWEKGRASPHAAKLAVVLDVLARRKVDGDRT